jgi:L-rhamnose-H+ transport protein
MTMTVWLGLGMTLVAGVLAGNSMLPMKFSKRWQWENTWLVFSLVSLVLIPWALALALVNRLGPLYASLPASDYAAPLLFGAGWGIAQVLFGLSVARLGLALGYAIIIALGAVLGTLVPLFVQNRAVLGTFRGALIFGGVVVMVTGIASSSWAGRLREGKPKAGSTYGRDVLIAVLCGLMAPMLNYAFAFGQPIAEAAVRMGTSKESAGYAVWPIALFGGLGPNLAYSIYLLQRNRTWGLFRAGWAHDGWMGVWMGIFWMGAMSLYGVGSVFLGVLGTSVGWGLFQIFMIMTANLSGVLTGEWKGAPRAAMLRLCGGLTLLAVATVLMAMGNS